MVTPKPTKQQQGQHAENAACTFLQQHGLQLIQRNFYSKRGEIDLIMRERDMLVFVEVRYRASATYGGAAASVTASKQQKIIAAARYFLHYHPQYASCAARFDVLAIQARGHDWHIDWIPAAFLAN